MEFNDYVKISQNIAEEAHRGQVRKLGSDKGKPYIIHPKRVADRVGGNRILSSIAFLHDVLEDTPVTDQDLIKSGIPTYIVDAVKVLTRQKGESYLDFILRVKDSTLALPVKIADIEDNMLSLEEGTLKDKYRLALHILKNNA